MEETEKLLYKEGDEINKETEEIINDAKTQIFQNPLEKYAVYNKFPFTLFCQLLIIIFTMFRLINNTKENEEGRYFKHFLYEMFLPLDDDNDEKDKTGFSYQQHLYIYNLEELEKIMNQSLDNYYNIETIAIENITYIVKDENGKGSPPEMHINYLNDKIKDIPGNLTYTLDEDYLGPISDKENAKAFINNITSFRIVYYLMSIIPPTIKRAKVKHICHEIEQIYSFESLANIDLYLNYQKMKCPYHNLFINNIWIEVFVIILSLLGLIVNIMKIIHNYKLYSSYRIEEEKQDKEEKKKRDILKDRFAKEDAFFNALINKKKSKSKNFKILDVWTGISLLSDAFQIIGSILTLCDPYQFNPLTGFITSMGISFSLLIFLRYFENLGICSILYATMRRGLRTSIHFLIGVIPVFFGFCIFAKCIFWRSEFFRSLTNSIATLFSLLHGDTLYGIFDDLIEINFFIGTIFSYFFCILFIVIVMNIFLGVVGEAFVSKKEKKYNQQWIYRILKMEENEKRRKIMFEEEKEIEKNKTPKELLQYKLNKIYEEFDNVQKLSVLIISKSTTKNIVELRSKFGEQLSILDKKMDSIKKTIKINA